MCKLGNHTVNLPYQIHYTQVSHLFLKKVTRSRDLKRVKEWATIWGVCGSAAKEPRTEAPSVARNIPDLPEGHEAGWLESLRQEAGEKVRKDRAQTAQAWEALLGLCLLIWVTKRSKNFCAKYQIIFHQVAKKRSQSCVPRIDCSLTPRAVFPCSLIHTRIGDS